MKIQHAEPVKDEPTTAEFLERKKHYTDQLMKFKDRLDEWKLRNPNRPPPIHIDDEGIVHWVNRKLRRQFKK